jgi:hypothetical protein
VKLIEHAAADRREEETIKERPNKIQTLNYYAEKIKEPRLRQTGKKDTRSATKTQERCNLGYGKN